MLTVFCLMNGVRNRISRGSSSKGGGAAAFRVAHFGAESKKTGYWLLRVINSPVGQIRGHREERRKITERTKVEAPAMLQHGRAVRS